MRKLHELTPCQKQYAEDHINLVHKFLSVKELPAKEYYDIIIFGYLAAVQEYDERPGLSRFSFTTIAWRKMSDCLCEYFTYSNRKKRKAVTVSIQSEESIYLDELLPGRRQNLLDSVSNRMYALELMSYLTKKEQEVVLLKANGLTYTEIAEHCGISPDGVNSRFIRMRQRLNQLLAVQIIGA